MLIVWNQRQGGNTTTVRTSSDPFAGINLEDPESSYIVLRHAVETGGTERTRELAIGWLDRQSRRQLALSAEQESYLLTKLAANGHSTWNSEYRFLFFNSAFNILHLGSRQEDLTRLLERLALEAPEKTMRLYALQHLAVQRGIGHVAGPLADKVQISLHALASQPGSPVAGTALATLMTWDGPETPADPKLIALALELAANPACEVDVRVSALQTANKESLSLSRQLAADETQPVHLRKAAIGLVGQHGEESDLEKLQTLCSENFRLAQAAEPALRAIQKRMANPQAAEPIPF